MESFFSTSLPPSIPNPATTAATTNPAAAAVGVPVPGYVDINHRSVDIRELGGGSPPVPIVWELDSIVSVHLCPWPCV